MRIGKMFVAVVFVLAMTATAHAQSSTPPPLSCPNAERYTEVGKQCTQATASNDLQSQATYCPQAALEAGQCAASESGIGKLDEIGNEATFAMTAGMAIYTTSHGENVNVAVDWLRVASALYKTLSNDPSAPDDMKAAAEKDLTAISQTSWYVDGPPPASPPGGSAAPPFDSRAQEKRTRQP
jgi:hypothetical protein